MLRAAEKKAYFRLFKDGTQAPVQEGIMNGMKIVQSLGMFVKASVTATAGALRKCIGGSLMLEDMARIKRKDLLYR